MVQIVAGSKTEVIAKLLRDEPVAPRARAPERAIPLELERVCLKALAKRPEDRQQSARELHDEVQLWLEAEADRAKRHERAGEKATEGRAKLAEYFGLKQEAARREAEAKEVGKQFKEWQPVEEKAELFAAEDRLREALRGSPTPPRT